MPQNNIKTRIKNKINSSNIWSSTLSSAVLLNGEIAFETDSQNGTRMKIGNGEDLYADLPYFNAKIVEDIAQLSSLLVGTNNMLTTILSADLEI